MSWLRYPLAFLGPSPGGTCGHLVTLGLEWGSRGECGALLVLCQGLASFAGLGYRPGSVWGVWGTSLPHRSQGPTCPFPYAPKMFWARNPFSLRTSLHREPDTTVLIGLLFNHLLIFKCGFTSLPMVCSPTSELHSYKLNIHKVYSSLVFSCCISCLNKVTYWKTSHWAGVCWRSFSMHTSLPFSKNLF